LTRPKKAAKIIARELGVPLSITQRAIARACGFRDWHDFEAKASAGLASILDQELSVEAFVTRQARLTLAIAECLGVPDGDVQHAMSGSRLTGDRTISLDEQIAIRVGCWRETSIPMTGPRQSGAVGRLTAPGRIGEPVILRSFGRSYEAVTHYSVATVADDEYASPKSAPPLFIPMQLYLPYGYWTESDGARVVFSRDYKPLWRLRPGVRPERVEPWKWIKWRSQDHLWEDAHTPWADPDVYASLLDELKANRIQTLPILADALPLLVNNTTESGLEFQGAADLLRALRQRPSQPKSI
jgi:hypothetical protein